MCEATAAPAAFTHSQLREYAHDPRVVMPRDQREAATYPGEIREEPWCRLRTHHGTPAAVVTGVLHRSNTSAKTQKQPWVSHSVAQRTAPDPLQSRPRP